MTERLLHLYKRWISAMFPRACRYVPTCSEYAAEAVARYGALRGGAIAAWRFVRCNPFSRGGHDPVICETATSDWELGKQSAQTRRLCHTSMARFSNGANGPIGK